MERGMAMMALTILYIQTLVLVKRMKASCQTGSKPWAARGSAKTSSKSRLISQLMEFESLALRSRPAAIVSRIGGPGSFFTLGFFSFFSFFFFSSFFSSFSALSSFFLLHFHLHDFLLRSLPRLLHAIILQKRHVALGQVVLG